jgi:hypothetical protein
MRKLGSENSNYVINGVYHSSRRGAGECSMLIHEDRLSTLTEGRRSLSVPGFTKPLVTGRFTAVTSKTGPAR